MKKNYCISSVLSIPQGMDRVQFTENGRIYPSSRNTVQHLREFRSTGSKLPIIIHWDFVYIISRYCMMKKSVQRDIINHMAELLNYADSDGHIEGVIMHTDWPLRKEVTKSANPEATIRAAYSSALWDTDECVNLVLSDINPVTQSILKFADDITAKLGHAPKTKVLLECTTKMGPQEEGSMNYLLSLIKGHSYLSDVYGIVYDTEHAFAGTGEWLDVATLKNINDSLCQVVVHLNTVPEKVKPKSRLDRHSDNTIFECSRNTAQYYEKYAEALDQAGIPWVREVHEDIMSRELSQIADSLCKK